MDFHYWLKLGVWVIKGIYKGAAAARLPIKNTPYSMDHRSNYRLHSIVSTDGPSLA